MGRLGNDNQILLAPEQLEGFFIHIDDRFVPLSDDQQSGSYYPRESVSGQIRTPAARYDRADFVALLGCGDQGSRGARAGAKIPEPQMARLGLRGQPFGGMIETRSQE